MSEQRFWVVTLDSIAYTLQELFPKSLVTASIITVAAIGIGFLVYVKKPKP